MLIARALDLIGVTGHDWTWGSAFELKTLLETRVNTETRPDRNSKWCQDEIHLPLQSLR
jgi:hypothetical protein